MSKRTTAELREARNKATSPGQKVTTSNGRRIVKMDPDTSKWHAEAYNVLATAYGCPNACGECGHPVNPGYCCGTCGTDAP